jgi:hypothetical protein
VALLIKQLSNEINGFSNSYQTTNVSDPYCLVVISLVRGVLLICQWIFDPDDLQGEFFERLLKNCDIGVMVFWVYSGWNEYS